MSKEKSIDEYVWQADKLLTQLEELHWDLAVYFNNGDGLSASASMHAIHEFVNETDKLRSILGDLREVALDYRCRYMAVKDFCNQSRETQLNEKEDE